MATTADAPTTASKLAAETFGTFLLVFGVIGTAIFSSSNTGILGVALAVGLAVLAGAYMVGGISGAHFNPAVTIGLAAAKRFAWKDVPGYLVAQFVGGLIATGLLALIVVQKGDLGTVFAGVSNGDVGGFGLVGVLVAEVVLTAVLVYVVLGSTAGTAPAGFAPIAIGLTLTVIHLVAIPISNASVNPARSLATAVFGGGQPLSELWIFFAAPLVGALIAGLTWKPLFAKKA